MRGLPTGKVGKSAHRIRAERRNDPSESGHRETLSEPSHICLSPKSDDSAELRTESPDVNLEIGLDVSVVRNTYQKKAA